MGGKEPRWGGGGGRLAVIEVIAARAVALARTHRSASEGVATCPRVWDVGTGPVEEGGTAGGDKRGMVCGNGKQRKRRGAPTYKDQNNMESLNICFK